MSNLHEYQYTRLPAGQYTRVIRLLPSRQFKKPIKILLDIVSLEPQPEYEALSYAWEGQTPDQAIECGGQRLLVTQTCLNALHRLRHKRHPRTLWIDGICIDQHSTEEKNHQVALMGPIYSSAQKIVVWLGEGRAGVDLLFKLLRHNRVTREIWSRWETSNFAKRAYYRHSAYMNSCLSGHGLHLSTLEESVPWFSRLWTVQEVQLSHKAVYLHGKTEVGFGKTNRSLLHALAAIKPRVGPVLPSLEYQMHLLRLRTHIYGVNGDGHKAWDERVNFVRRTALGKAALPHDKIYAVRAILQRNLKEDIFPLPDYDSDFHEIYWESCVILMRRSKKGLELIQDVGGSGNPSSIPSWVPDFNRPIQGFHSVLEVSSMATYVSGSRKPQVLLFDNDTRIATRAHLVTLVTGTVDHPGLDTLFRTLETDEERLCAALSAAECAWLWINAADALSQNSTSDPSRYELTNLMFRHMHIGPSETVSMRLLELIHKADQSTFDLARFKEHQNGPHGASSTTKASLVKSTRRGCEVNLKALLSWNKAEDDIDPAPEEGLWDAFRSFWDSCNGSAFFWAEDNALGISLPARRVGDVVAIMPGLNWPMLLRRSTNANFKVVGPAYFGWGMGYGSREEDEMQDIVLE